MGLIRKPFQGVFNIIRFNWHFYLIACLVVVCLLFFKHALPKQIQPFLFCLSIIIISTISNSLIISFYVYDFSDLYLLKWLPNLDKKQILNINAGFDETSEIIKGKFQNSELTICDFYNPINHTEVSIKRARKAYPPLINTIHVTTNNIPFQDQSFDYIIAILSAHEIRDEMERIQFFKELNRITKLDGQIFVTEHVRDINNFIAYTIGFLHFHSKSVWLSSFEKSNLKVKDVIKTTPFITTFILEKNGDTL